MKTLPSTHPKGTDLKENEKTIHRPILIQKIDLRMTGFGYSRQQHKKNTKRNASESCIKEEISKSLDAYQLGHLDAARIILENVLQSDQENSFVLGFLATIEKALGNYEKALKLFKQSTDISQDNSSILNNYSELLAKDDLEKAIFFSNKAISISPNNSGFLQRNGYLKWKVGDLDNALQQTIKAIKIDPGLFDALMNLSCIYKDLGNPDQALVSTLKALELKPNNPDALINLGGIYKDLGNLDQAITSTFKSRGEPDNPNAHENLGILYLLTGDYKNGWEKFEYRLEREESSLYFNPNIRRWTIEKCIHVRQLLVVAEQGIGDIIQFCRYIKVLRSEGIEIRFCLDPKLHSLMRVSSIEEQPLNKNEAIKITDGHWVPLMSIPRILGVSPDKPITTEPYIRASDNLIKKWKSVFSGLKRPVIGINWKSNRKDIHINDRDIPIRHFLEMIKKTNATFVFLQRDILTSELNEFSSHQIDLEFQSEVTRMADSDDPEDFHEYAAIVTNCNLIITTDTTVAHLAASIGKATWIFVPKSPNWRWGLDGDKSFWYTVKLFRQKKWGVNGTGCRKD